MTSRDDFAEWAEGPYRRQLERQLREFVGPQADHVLSLALRIHARVDGDAGREILTELASCDTDDERREMLGRIGRIAYLAALVWAIRLSTIEHDGEDWRLDEIARAARWLMGRGDILDRG